VTRWLSAAQEQAWRSFLQLNARLATDLNRQLQTESGLSLADYDVLVQLTDTRDGRLRPYELQRLLHWEQSRLSHHLSRMQRRGLVERVECEEDGRGAYIAVTGEGRAAIRAAAPGHVRAVRRLFVDALTADELDTLGQLSAHLLSRVASGND
jgi:DNA-binding MarR family transcriptional regulator